MRHVGPMAQDFYAAFGVGEDNRRITSIDEDGIVFVAIKALNARLVQKDAAMQAQNQDLTASVQALTARVATLETTAARIHIKRTAR